VSHGPADAWDCGFGALMKSKVDGQPWISIPAFPNRKFRLAYIQVHAAAGISSAKDLEGKRVGISGWNNTAGIWARGALQEHYGVDLGQIDWRCVRTSGAPPEITITPLPQTSERDEQLDTLLVNGELDAVISPNVMTSVSRRDPRVGRLFS